MLLSCSAFKLSSSMYFFFRLCISTQSETALEEIHFHWQSYSNFQFQFLFPFSFFSKPKSTIKINKHVFPLNAVNIDNYIHSGHIWFSYWGKNGALHLKTWGFLTFSIRLSLDSLLTSHILPNLRVFLQDRASNQSRMSDQTKQLKTKPNSTNRICTSLWC